MEGRGELLCRQTIGIPVKPSRPLLKIASVYNKLNFGCGYDKRAGYLNVDLDPVCSPDLLIGADGLSSLPRAHFEHVVANDVLEHIPRAAALPTLLELADLTVIGGRLDLSTSSILGVADAMAGKTFADQFNWTRCLFGNQAHAGDFHYGGFTEATLTTYLSAAGYETNSLRIEDNWLFKVEATKVFDWSASATESLSDAAFLERAFQLALWRGPEGSLLAWCHEQLGVGEPRREILKHLFGCEERLFSMALRAGL